MALVSFFTKLKMYFIDIRFKVINMIKKLMIASVAIAATLAFSGNAQASDKKHFPGLFLGATTIDSETDFSYGLEYEYKFSHKWGAGFTWENTEDAHAGAGVEVMLASVYFHPTEHLRLGLGFGQEEVGAVSAPAEHHIQSGDAHGHPSHEEDLYRISASYAIPLGNFEIEPTIAADFVDDETSTVVGVAIVYPF